jgi:hypothetical protein
MSLNNSIKPDVDYLVNILKSIEGLTTTENYKNLCFFLTMKKIEDHPDFQD